MIVHLSTPSLENFYDLYRSLWEPRLFIDNYDVAAQMAYWDFGMDPKILYLPRCRSHCMSFSPKMLKNLYRWPASRWINKQNAFHGIAGSPLFTGSLQFPGASFSRFLNIIFITVYIWGYRAWPAFKSSANCAIYKCFGQWLFCFNCLFTNLLGLGPPIADSWHIQFSRRKWRHI